MRRACCLLLVLALPCLPRAQSPTWTVRSTSPPPLSFGLMAYDLARGRSVLVAPAISGAGGMDTWEWDGVRWWVIRPAVVPPARQIETTALAFDAVRARTVMFGGDPNNSTWEWDGVAWSQHSPAIAPSPRLGHRMAFDFARGRTVLFGGLLGTLVTFGLFSDETWEWDGVNWTQRLPATRPSARGRHAMAYDLLGNRIVMFGGQDRASVQLGDTWEWDGSNWTQRFPLHSPGAVQVPAGMVFDLSRGVTLLYSGSTWTWNGIDWTRLSPPTSPTVGGSGGFAFDIQRQRAVLYGGSSSIGAVSALTWEWDGSNWTEIRAGPSPRAWTAMAYADQRGSTLLFGGLMDGPYPDLDDAWEWNGSSWSQRTTPSRPNARERTAIVYDSMRDRYVLFGGFASGGTSGVAFGDTWELDRTNWIPRARSSPPPARSSHAMAFDRNRGRVVLFGGERPSGGVYSDTWEWNGSSWTQLALFGGPLARAMHAMTFDPVGGRTLLFGGISGGPLNDLWQWNGSTWQQRSSATVPPARVGHVMTWDAARGRAVVFGGTDYAFPHAQAFADTWEWDGANWTQAAPISSPLTTAFAAGAYDSQRGTHVVFGGQWTPGTLNLNGELWEYATPGFAIASTFGQGCGTPPLTASPAAGSRPILGATQTIDIGNVPAGVATMAYGFSMRAIGTTSLPLDLGSIGMAGCSALQSCDSLFEPCASSGPATATYSVSVPNLPSLLSLRVWLQAWAPAPGQNPAGLIASNAVSLLLGSQ